MRFVSVLTAAVFFAGTAYAASPQPKKEIDAAMTHAGLAAESSDISQVHMHLHHALNCLVGPKGDGYSSKDMDPCSALGGGLLTDLTEENQVKIVKAAVMSAKAGIAADDLEKAKVEAASTKAALATIKE